MRGFIAVNLPEAVRSELHAAASPLRELARDVRWTAPEAMHLTLVFLGHFSEERVPALTAAIEVATRERRPFRIRLKGAGAFPNARRPRVWWIGVDASDALLELQRAVEHETEVLGFGRENRPYMPHLTIGRTRGEPRPMAGAAARLAQFDGGADFDVRSIELMESRLSPAGARYSEVASAPLAGVGPRAARAAMQEGL